MLRVGKTLCGYDVYHGVVVGLSVEFLLSFLGEFDYALGIGEDRKITSHFHALAWEPLGPFLSDDDIAGDYRSTSEDFYASSFRL